MKLRATIVAFMALSFGLASFPSHAVQQKTFSIGANRPTTVFLPLNLRPNAPLLIMLHSYSTSGDHQERYMNLRAEANRRGIVYMHPDGTIDKKENHFWNASKACCDNFNAQPNDVDYISSLIAEVKKKVSIDPNRIYLVGHSNGAFMSLAYACKTGKIAGVVSLAGAMDKSFSCATSKPTALLEIHGTRDATIKFQGRTFHSVPITSAAQTTQEFARINGCADPLELPTSFSRIDFEPTIKGAETKVFKYSGCKAPTALWQIDGGAHSPKLPKNYPQLVIDFLTQG